MLFLAIALIAFLFDLANLPIALSGNGVSIVICIVLTIEIPVVLILGRRDHQW